MRLKRVVLLFVSLSLFLSFIFVVFLNAKQKFLDSFGTEIEKAIVNSKFSKDEVGVVVIDVKAKRVVFSLNEGKPFAPASNMKIFTTASAIFLLGEEYIFDTSFYYDGEIKEGVLNGDLVIKGAGDPNISGRFHNDNELFLFNKVAEGLKQKGVKKIVGNIILDDTIFDKVLYNPYWRKEHRNFWYGAEISALSFNDNCVALKIKPSGIINKPPDIFVSPDTKYVNIINGAKTIRCGARRRNTISLFREPGSNKIFVKGGICATSHGITDFIPIHNPTLFFGTVFMETLQKNNIDVKGNLVIADKPIDISNKRKLVSIKSNLRDTISVTNKRSQNFYAECLLKLLGYKFRGAGSFENGSRVVKDFLMRKVGNAYFLNDFKEDEGKNSKVDNLWSNFRMLDGSGLADDNRVTPLQVAYLLYYILKSQHSQLFIKSLSIAGVDGSLRHRFKKSLCYRRLFAKTGQLINVNNLSGYLFLKSPITDKKGNLSPDLIFSILINRKHKSNSMVFASNLQEKMCDIFYRYISGNR